MTERLLVSIPDAMNLLEISHSMLYKLISQGQLKRTHIGRRAFITRASIDAYMARLTEAAS
jgi:excisionase family DNA binding protein